MGSAERQTGRLAFKDHNFPRVVATLTGKAFDRLFGKRLLSPRFIVTSIYLSLASLLLFIAVVSKIAPNPQFGSFSGTLLQAAALGLAGLVPALTDNKFVRVVWWIAVVVIPLSRIIPFFLFVVAKRGLVVALRGTIEIVVPFTVSFASDIVYIVLTRWSLRRVARADRFHNIILIGLANLIILAALLLGPIFLGLEVARYAPLRLTMFSFVFNSIDFLIASSALFVALALLVDRLLWWVVLRPLYAAQRFRIIENKQFLWGIGLSLIFLPTHVTWRLLRTLLR